MDFSLNWLAIGVVTIGSFVFGAVWFGAVFAKVWQQIHHGDKKFSESEMKKMQEGEWKIMLAEFIATLIMIIGLACLIEAIPSMDAIRIAVMVWIGFILTMTTSTVIWGNDRREVMLKKIVVFSLPRLITLMASGYILSMWR